MNGPSCLNDPKIRIVADASIIININATGFASDVLHALPQRPYVVQEVVNELNDGLHTGRTDATALSEWISSGYIELVELGPDGLAHFMSLVTGSAAETLDDGEAATLAYAMEIGITPVIDERKAERICRARFPKLGLACSLDILGHDNVLSNLGAERFSDAIYNALSNGRMRIPHQYIDWVVKIIGEERAEKCRSLPLHVRSRLRRTVS